MNNIIQISENKVLKLMNALIVELNLQETNDISQAIVKMENYLKSKAALPVGPLIQKTEFFFNDDGQIELHTYMIRQANTFIHNVEQPYKMESLLRVGNCIYAHYVGPESKLKLAYDKINVIAFENGIDLSSESYTIFVNQEDDLLTADVFVEKKKNE